MMKFLSTQDFFKKIKAAAIHLLLSIIVASIAAYMVFGVWFPYPYNEVAGGKDLFILIIWVDICCGPLMTLVLYNINKSRRELMIDLSLVGLVQLAALLYGIYTVMLARPVYLVFEVDRFRVITLTDLVAEELPLAHKDFQKVPLFSGPRVIATQPPAPTSPDYQRTIDLALQGFDISSRPIYWRPYREKAADVLARAKPVKDLVKNNPDKESLIMSAIEELDIAKSELVYLPMQTRKSFEWVVLLNAKTADVVGFIAVPGFL